MGLSWKRDGTYDHSYNVGDRIKWKRTGEIMTVGDDWDELEHWGSISSHIVTTSGRVLSIDEITRI